MHRGPVTTRPRACSRRPIHGHDVPPSTATRSSSPSTERGPEPPDRRHAVPPSSPAKRCKPQGGGKLKYGAMVLAARVGGATDRRLAPLPTTPIAPLAAGTVAALQGDVLGSNPASGCSPGYVGATSSLTGRRGSADAVVRAIECAGVSG